MKEILHGATLAFIIKVIGTGAAFLFNLLLARVLGADGAGIYYLALMVTTIGSVIGRFGLDNAMLRHISANASDENWRAVKGVYRLGLLISMVLSLIVTIAIYLAAPWIANYVFETAELETAIKWMSLAIIPFSLLNLQAQSLMALKKIKDSQFIQSVSIPVMMLLVIFFLANNWDIVNVIWIYNIAVISTALLGFWLWRRAGYKVRDVEGSFSAKILFQSSIPLFWVSLFILLSYWSATIALGIWGTSEDVGVYNVAARTAALVSFVLVAVNSIAAPKFSALYMQGDICNLGATAVRTTNLMVVVASPVLLVFFIFPTWVMGLFGEDFIHGAYVLSIIAFGQAINVATGSVGVILTMSGKEKVLRNIVALSAVLNIVFLIFLVPSYGLIGAAVATSLGMVALSLVAAWYVYKLLGIKAYCMASLRL